MLMEPMVTIEEHLHQARPDGLTLILREYEQVPSQESTSMVKPPGAREVESPGSMLF